MAVASEFNHVGCRGLYSAIASASHHRRADSSPDQGGHAAGDEAIRQFACLLRETLRSSDVPGRYGGEEFGVLLPATDGAQAMDIMQQIRKSLHEKPLLGKTAVTVSFGVAPFSADTFDAIDWIRQADELLYRAKAMGRDRVVLAVSADDQAAPNGHRL